MKRVVSVSLGTSKRDKKHELEILGEPFLIERRGTDGDLDRFAATFFELDGQVDALGVGGADIYVVVGERSYTFRQIKKLISGAKVTPVVDGSGLKHTLERETIRWLAQSATIDFTRSKVLLVSAVDRFGMAQALVETGADVVYGDILFGLGLPIRLRNYRMIMALGKILLPIITRLPFKWFYPTGEKQERRQPKHEWAFREANVIAGDWHYIRRYAPEDLAGKTIITQTLRQADLEWLRQTRAARAITTTPVMGGETFATNVIEGVLVALLGKRPESIMPNEYLSLLEKLGWMPTVLDLQREHRASPVSP